MLFVFHLQLLYKLSNIIQDRIGVVYLVCLLLTIVLKRSDFNFRRFMHQSLLLDFVQLTLDFTLFLLLFAK